MKAGWFFFFLLHNGSYVSLINIPTTQLFCVVFNLCFYSYFRTNLPKEVMAFPDFPFPSEWKSFMTHQQVLKYLEDYTSHFNLYKYIHFNSAITSVNPLMGVDKDQPQWEVVVTNVDTKESQVHMFDAVIVCSG